MIKFLNTNHQSRITGDLAWWTSSDGWEVVGKGVTSSTMEYVIIIIMVTVIMIIMVTVMITIMVTVIIIIMVTVMVITLFQSERNLCKSQRGREGWNAHDFSRSHFQCKLQN